MAAKVASAVLGFPRIGKFRELKKAVESFWSGSIPDTELVTVGRNLRLTHWKLQKQQGVDVIPSNDFAFYDQVLDHSILFNAIPDRFKVLNLSPLDTMFAMGRGLQRPATADTPQIDARSGEMVKWFDSNYHFIKPELSHNTQFKLNSKKPIEEFLEAREIGIHTRPVIIGPVTFLYLSKASKDSTVEPIALLSKLLPVYQELLKELAAVGADWVQIDEPILVYDLPAEVVAAYKTAYSALASSPVKLMFTTYFGDVGSNISILKGLPVAGVHVDLVRGRSQLEPVLSTLDDKQFFSAGVVDGRNIWKTNLKNAIDTVQIAVQKLGAGRVIVASSSSLLHTPFTIESEKKLPAEIKLWFSFATEKCKELALIAQALTQGCDSIRNDLDENAKAIKARQESEITNDKVVRERQSKVTTEMHQRKSPLAVRQAAQKVLNLPLFPTTTIGSFPQTNEIRVARNKFIQGEISAKEYEAFIEKEIQSAVKFQEEIDLDVLVHGEAERTDMVEYFAQRLKGFAFTTNGWVQSYGTRCVRPPIIIGDISRPAPMTVKESKFAQSLTKKPMKGMLTGPVTNLRWSFPRDDVDQSVQAQQLALALRDEVLDLEQAGIYVIQVDEPALREGLPLRRGEWDPYLRWAVDAFRLTTSGVQDRTQCHSHFCYSDFNDIFDAIVRLDADVISIEHSKSDSKLLQVFKNHSYPAHIGPGLFDVHAPRVPPVSEFTERIDEMLKFIPASQIWLNPDCGLKTRKWPETIAQLKNMIEAAKIARAKQAQK